MWGLTALLATELGVAAASPVVPLVVGSEEDALALSAALLAAGFHVPAIRPPTVAPGTCRLRVSLSAGHTRAQVLELVAALKSAMAARPGLRLLPLPHLAAPPHALLQAAPAGWQKQQQQPAERRPRL